MWEGAASMKAHPEQFPWDKFPWQKAIIHFTRLLGSVQNNQPDSAQAELDDLNRMYEKLKTGGDFYKANQVQIQIRSSEAWILFKEGKLKQALELMNMAADMEDKTEKSPVTPGEIIPARELLGDMLFQAGQYSEALKAYEADLQKHPNRFNALFSAGMAAQKSGNPDQASRYFRQLLSIAVKNSDRVEIVEARSFLNE